MHTMFLSHFPSAILIARTRNICCTSYVNGYHLGRYKTEERIAMHKAEFAQVAEERKKSKKAEKGTQ
jgi:hypothetical protein